MKFFYALLVLLLVGGCQTEENYRAYLQQDFGLSEKELISKWGIPDKTYEVDGAKFLTYQRKSHNYVPPSTTVNGNGANTQFNTSGGYYVDRNCDTTFTLEKNQVVNCQFTGNDCVM